MSFGIFKRKPRFKSAIKRMADVPVVHKTVPDEVLYPDGKPEPAKELAWLDDVPLIKNAQPKPAVEQKPEAPKAQWSTSRSRAKASAPSQEAAPVPAAVAPAAPAAAAPVRAAVSAAPIPATANPNREISDRPKHPVGWLVVVEGPGVGEWFVLENGASHIGSGRDQTVRLTFGDETVAPTRHAAVIYDTYDHSFTLAGQPDLRLNGKLVNERAQLRDGDVFTVGNTSLRMVALCTPNFHWES